MILSLDTSSERLSLALRENGKTLGSLSQHSQNRHNETLLPLLDQLLGQAGRTKQDIRAVAVGLGPGSFTGVRVGLATAFGLAQAKKIPVVGISSYLALAAGSSFSKVLVVGDARQGKVYAAGYALEASSGWEEFMPECLVSAEELIPLLPTGPLGIAGPYAPEIFQRLAPGRADLTLAGEDQSWPDAEIIAQLADNTIPSPSGNVLAKGGSPLSGLAPSYLRRTQAEEQKLNPAGK